MKLTVSVTNGEANPARLPSPEDQERCEIPAQKHQRHELDIVGCTYGPDS